MRLTALYSDRAFRSWPSWHVVYEWEDQICEHLNLNILDSRKAACISSKVDAFAGRVLKETRLERHLSLDQFFSRAAKDPFLRFEMGPVKVPGFSTSENAVPVLIDFWGNEDVDRFNWMYRKCKAVLISSAESFEFLKQKCCPLNIVHFPYSLPDRYRLAPGVLETEKKFDIVLPGRKNAKLWEFLKEFERKNSEIEYLYQTQVDGKTCYVSNRRGMVGEFHSRHEYMDLLRSCRIAFYSTPGIDGGEDRTGGFNPVTPRLFEVLAAGCQIIARYPKNADTDYFDLANVCTSIDTYDLFEKELSARLNQAKTPLEKNVRYLEAHYTSNRFPVLSRILESL